MYYFGPRVPTLDKNDEAYFYILSGLKCGEYAKAKEMFDWAYSTSDDPQLRYVADYQSRECDLFLKAGITSFEEVGSMEGGIKACVDGFLRPMDGVSALSQLFQEWFGEYRKDCSQIDERYHQRIHDYWATVQNIKNLWCVLLIVPPFVSSFCFVMYARSQRNNAV